MPQGPVSEADRARRRGALAAAREHRRLGSPLDAPVDIYSVIRHANVWLMFQPLDHLYGAYFREGNAAGIIINAKHPQSLKRFTAAHEYGHHVLGHEPVLDEEGKIEPSGQAQAPHEVEAQAFAASFLMPLHLVNRVLKRLGLSDLALNQLTPRDAYLIALELGVSYAAAVTHLTTLGKISPAHARVLRQEEPRAIKQAVARGMRPADPWADTWPLELRDAGKVFYPRVRDEVHLYLPESPTTGYIWTIQDDGIADLRNPDAAPAMREHVHLAWVVDDFEPESGSLFGSSGVRHFVFRVIRPGTHRLFLAHHRPWDTKEQPVETFTAHLEIESTPLGNVSRGLSDAQQPLMAVA